MAEFYQQFRKQVFGRLDAYCAALQKVDAKATWEVHMELGLTESAKQFVRSRLQAQGWDIIRRAANNGPSIALLPLLIEYCVLTDGKGTVLQVGANDGLLDDPVYHVIEALSLTAILVEPLSDRLEKLRRNYSSRHNIHFENVAVSTESGEAQMFRINPAAKHLPEWVQGIASFDKSTLLKHRHWPSVKGKRFDQYVESVRVPVVTISQLLQKHSGIPKVIALQVDTEGHDFAVLRSAIDAECLPRVINYEHKHLTYSDQVSCRDLLSSRGYSFLANQIDTIAYRAA
jgi:FkbM family methyltransferase